MLTIRNSSGFTLIELMIVVMVVMLVAGFGQFMVGSALKARDVDMSVRAVSLEMRRARQLAVDWRRQTRVTFTTPRSITIESKAPASEGGAWSQVSSSELSGDLEFYISPSLSGGGPEGHSTSYACDFDGSGASQVYFMPDGSAITGLGQTSNGVVYVSRQGEIDTTRAVTLFGTTGRLKRWTYVSGGSWE